MLDVGFSWILQKKSHGHFRHTHKWKFPGPDPPGMSAKKSEVVGTWVRNHPIRPVQLASLSSYPLRVTCLPGHTDMTRSISRMAY